MIPSGKGEAEKKSEAEMPIHTGEFLPPEADFGLYGIDEKHLKKEKSRARTLRETAWWRRKKSAGICYYCRCTFKPSELTMDHKIPLARGGSSVRENIVACCKECNNQKKNLLPAEWTEHLNRLQEENAAVNKRTDDSNAKR